MTAAWIRTYEHDGDYIESLGGIDWADMPSPPRWHRCRVQTRGWVRMTYVERCACGAIRAGARDPWAEKNRRREGGA